MHTPEDGDKALLPATADAGDRETRSPSSGWTQFLWVPLLSFAVFHLDAAAYYAVLWWQGVQGGMEGLKRSMGSGFWLNTMLPWMAFIFVLHAISGRPQARAKWALAPAVTAGFLGLFFLAMGPPILRPRFEEWMKANMPTEVTELLCKLHGFGIAGGSDTYSFTCSPKETDRLIREMKLEKCEFSSRDERDDSLPSRGGLVDCRDWPGVEMYQGSDGTDCGWSYELVTDATHTKVFVRAARC